MRDARRPDAVLISSVPLWEIVLRTALLYLAVLGLLRLAGKREMGASVATSPSCAGRRVAADTPDPTQPVTFGPANDGQRPSRHVAGGETIDLVRGVCQSDRKAIGDRLNRSEAS